MWRDLIWVNFVEVNIRRKSFRGGKMTKFQQKLVTFLWGSFSGKFLIAEISSSKFLVAKFFQKQPSRGVHITGCSENMQQIYRRTPMTSAAFLQQIIRCTGGATVCVWTLKKCFQIFSHFRKTLTTVSLVNIYLRNNRLYRLFSLVRVTWIDFRYSDSY